MSKFILIINWNKLLRVHSSPSDCQQCFQGSLLESQPKIFIDLSTSFPGSAERKR